MMEERRQRRFSTAQQINPDTMKVMNRLDSIPDVEEGAPQPYRKNSIPHKLTSTIGQLALFKDDEDEGQAGGQSFISGFTTPGPKERATSAKKKVNYCLQLQYNNVSGQFGSYAWSISAYYSTHSWCYYVH